MKLDFINPRLERKILIDLYESVNGIFAFTFYSKYKIEPDKMFEFIIKYEENGILIYENEKLTLTHEGKDVILKQMFHKKNDSNKFSNIPEDFIKEKIKINSLYLPNFSKVSLEILNIKGGKETSN